MRRVQTEETVAAVARDLQIGWHTVMRAVVAYDTLLIDDPNRLAGVDTLGIDEHVQVHTSATRRTGHATDIVDVTSGRPARLLDVVPGRSGKVYADWIAEREAEWGVRIQVAALELLPNCPVPEVARLARILRTRDELLAYFATYGVSNGPTEAMNLLIEQRRRAAHGFRKFCNYRL